MSSTRLQAARDEQISERLLGEEAVTRTRQWYLLGTLRSALQGTGSISNTVCMDSCCSTHDRACQSRGPVIYNICSKLALATVVSSTDRLQSKSSLHAMTQWCLHGEDLLAACGAGVWQSRQEGEIESRGMPAS